MSLSHLSNDELADGLRSYLLEAEARARAGDHPFILVLLLLAHRALDDAQSHAKRQGVMTRLAGGTEKGP